VVKIVPLIAEAWNPFGELRKAGEASVKEKPMKETSCRLHGRQGIGLVCEHVALAVDRNECVGFFWGDDTDTGRPDAWCLECEQALRALNGASSEQWLRNARFKTFCVKCWDEAKSVCGGRRAKV
jgi:hypothetical protein